MIDLAREDVSARLGAGAHKFADALRPLSTRIGPAAREFEVLRVAATLHGKDVGEAARLARTQVLAWAQNRSGGRLPPAAWDFESFEYFAGGRNSLAVRLIFDGGDVWTIRADDPDKTVPGRIWTTEVAIGSLAGQRPRFSCRQLVNTAEPELLIEPHSPGLILQLADVCGLSIGPDEVNGDAWTLTDDGDAEELVDRLLSPERLLPTFVLTGDIRSVDPQTPALDPVLLQRAAVGLAHVVVVGAEQTRVLTSRLGSRHSVFHGGVRAYLPGFSTASDPFSHRLITAERLSSEQQREQAYRWLRSLAASLSVRRNRLGKEVPAFGDIRNASLRALQVRLAGEGASDGQQLAAAKASIQALEERLSESLTMQDMFDGVAETEKTRAETAEEQLRSANYYIQQIQRRMASIGANLDEGLIFPSSWHDFADWCESNFAGRLALAAPARRNVKDGVFEDVEQAARAVHWLATTYRDGRMNGADGSFRDFILEEGVRNSLCGGDEFEIDWQGRRPTVDWHIKGGSSREPRHCLRIYYFWEPDTQQVVVADMPHHRRTALS